MDFSNEGFCQTVLRVLDDSHAHYGKSGGLFNAYEPVLHFEIFSAALAAGCWQSEQELPIGVGQGTCDLKIVPPSGKPAIWLEVKIWWFLHAAYATRYDMQPKTKFWALHDWERLDTFAPESDGRALLLMRVWDSEAGKITAEKWLTELSSEMERARAPRPLIRELEPQSYRGPRPHTRTGDLILWARFA